jgi:N-acetylmuramoyl-L-alanine amidase
VTLWAVVIGLVAPTQIVIATPRGQTVIPVTMERGTAAVAAPLLAGPLGLTSVVGDSQTTVTLDGTAFVLQVGIPFARVGGTFCNLAAEPYVTRDTLFLPLVFLSECVPHALAPKYRWDPVAGRLVEGAPRPPRPEPTPNPMTGLRHHHVVAVDAGHGGVDPGNPGVFFRRGVTEKDVTLSIARLLRGELARRGIEVVMVRTSDTLIDLHDRPSYCVNDCDLFVSIHVNSMGQGRNNSKVEGIETYFLSTAKTEDAARVAKMENDAVRYERGGGRDTSAGMDRIFKSLTDNENLRESARLAALIQQRVASVAPGGDRGVQQAPFWVLKDARRPAVLVETGFATNRSDAQFLSTGAGQQQIAVAIADGIVTYLKEFEHKTAAQGAAR